MFSRIDIENELGKGINIYPFHQKNIKENSINFTIGRNAWTLGSGSVFMSSIINTNASENHRKAHKEPEQFRKGQSAVRKYGGKQYVILLPHSTTIVETSEVIGVSNYIGGTLHSKVGIAAQGVGAIGTMLGPCFAGHLMISLHNVTDKAIAISVGDTFGSIVFYKLDSPSRSEKNSNISGHVDKLSELGITIDKDTREYLTQDWKCNVNGIRDKMKKSEEFVEYKRQLSRNKCERLLKYINLKNAIFFAIILVIFIIGGIAAKLFDNKSGNTVWMDRYITIVISVLVIPALSKLFHQIKAD